MIDTASAPLERTPFEVLTRFRAVALVLVLPPFLAASAEAFAVLAVAWSGKHDEDDRLCLP